MALPCIRVYWGGVVSLMQTLFQSQSWIRVTWCCNINANRDPEYSVVFQLCHLHTDALPCLHSASPPRCPCHCFLVYSSVSFVRNC